MNHYERNIETGVIRRSDGKEKSGYTQVEFMRCHWIKVPSRFSSKYKLRLPYVLTGHPMSGGQFRFDFPYKKVQGDV
jgi:hypothetical protein